MKKPKLPYFAVRGDLQSLVEIEPILVMLGYDSDNEEDYNNERISLFSGWHTEPKYIGCFGHEGCHLLYSNAEPHNCSIFFDSWEVERIIEYVEDYKLRHSYPARKKSIRKTLKSK